MSEGEEMLLGIFKDPQAAAPTIVAAPKKPKDYTWWIVGASVLILGALLFFILRRSPSPSSKRPDPPAAPQAIHQGLPAAQVSGKALDSLWEQLEKSNKLQMESISANRKNCDEMRMLVMDLQAQTKLLAEESRRLSSFPRIEP